MSRGPIAIVDTVCPRPYSARTLADGALGGTEATVVRIAEGLDAQVYQHNRDEPEGRYRPLDRLETPAVLIVLRDPKAAVEIAERHAGVPLVLWMHDLVEPGRDRAKRLLHHRAALAGRDATIVAVSDFHRAQIQSVLDGDEEAAAMSKPTVMRLYNPVRPGLAPVDAGLVDRDRLVFFSAAHKGLAYALFVFAAVKRRWPSMRFEVANPGYLAQAIDGQDGVVDLGARAQADILDVVARSLCTFNPNFEYPETFGLVLAESNAVGTPVLAHPIGAAPEILDDPRQIVATPTAATAAYRLCRRAGAGRSLAIAALRPTGAFDAYLDRIALWRDGERPVVHARPAFDLVRVLDQWRALVAH